MAALMAAIVVVVATVAATAVSGKDKGGNRDGRGHRQQSTKSGSKDMVVVATVMDTANAGVATTAVGAPTTAMGAPMTAASVPTTALGVSAEGTVFATATGATMTDMSTATLGTSTLVQYFLPLLEEAHAEEEEAIMGGFSVLVVVVRVVCAGYVCAACPCCFVRLTCISAPNNWQTTAYWGLPECSR
jgi:hypothetical protein